MEKNIKNFFYYLFSNNKIKLIHILIIIGFINILKSQGNYGQAEPGQSEEIFKILLAKKYNIIFALSNYKIYSFDGSTLNIIAQTQLVENLQNQFEGKMISLSESIYDNDSFQKIYMIVKNNLYIFHKNGNLIKNVEITNMGNNLPSIIIQSENSIDSNIISFFIALIDENKKLKIYLIKHTISNDEFIFEKDITMDIINSSGQNTISKSDFVTCQIMYINSNEKYLTCFYENENIEIGTYYFETENLVKINTKSSKFRKNSGAKILKSVLYSNKSKAFVCYINSLDETACLSFDIIENQWSNYEYKYLEECNMDSHFFSFDYFDKSNEYVLTCFSSFSEFKSIVFNSNMELNNKGNDNNNDYCISNNQINSCNGQPLQSIINYNNNYKIILSCYMNIGQLSTENFSQLCTSSELIVLNSYSLTTSNPIDTEITNYSTQEDLSQALTLHTSYNALTNIIEPNNNKILNPIIKKNTHKTKEDISYNLDNLIKDVEVGKIYEIKGDDYGVKISPINFKDYEGSSTYINFLECENTLRLKNNIPQDSILTVVQIEIYKYDEKSLTNQVEYAVYNDQKRKLDLSVCDKDKIEINYAITNLSALDLEKISYFANMDVDVFNSKDEFFNDICFSYSEKKFRYDIKR